MKGRITVNYFSEELRAQELEVLEEDEGVVTVTYQGEEFCLLKYEYEVVKK